METASFEFSANCRVFFNQRFHHSSVQAFCKCPDYFPLIVFKAITKSFTSKYGKLEISSLWVFLYYGRFFVNALGDMQKAGNEFWKKLGYCSYSK